MNSKSLKKSAVALALLLVMGSVGFNSAYGYGGGGGGTKAKVTLCQNGNTISVASRAVPALLRQGATRGACVTAPVTTPAPLVLGATNSNSNRSQQYLPVLTSVSTLLMSVQSGNQNGDISNEDAAKLTSQLAGVISALMALFR